MGKRRPLEDRRLKISCNGEVREVLLERDTFLLDGRRIEFERPKGELRILTVADRRHRCRAVRAGERVFVWCDGDAFEFLAATSGRRAAAERGDLLAPMPGRVLKNLVEPGQSVERGQVLLILEAMKMEHAIRAPRDGTVARLAHREGDLVEAGVALAEIVPTPER